MAGLPVPLRRFAARGLTSALAMGLALAGGAAAVTGIASGAAMAQEQRKPPNSRGFAQAYEPLVALVNAATIDLAAVKAQLPAMIAAVENDTDRHTAGNLVLLAGTKGEDRALQRQGLEMMLASGQVAPEQLGQFHYFVGSLAYDAKDFAAARTALEAARTAGYQSPDLEGLLAETYFGSGQHQQGLEVLEKAIESNRAAGAEVPENWIKRGLMVAYDNKLAPQATAWAAKLVSAYPTPQNWAAAVQIIGETNPGDSQFQLDLMRLMSLTGSMSDRRQFVGYIEAADPRIMSNEVAKVLSSAVAAGALTEGEEYYQDVKRIIDERMAADRNDAPKMAEEARAASNGRPAMNAGDVYFSLDDFAMAEEMYSLAVDKGGIDADRVLTRLGIAQVRQGKLEEAKATFGRVSGARAPLATLWEAYVDSKA